MEDLDRTIRSSGPSEASKSPIKTYPYPVNKGFPTYETDSGNFGRLSFVRELTSEVKKANCTFNNLPENVRRLPVSGDDYKGDSKKFPTYDRTQNMKRLPTYDTDSQQYGKNQMQKAESLTDVSNLVDGLVKLHKSVETRASDPNKQSKLKKRKDKAGNIVPRPPLSRSSTVGDLQDIKFVGPNYSHPSEEMMKNKKSGIRLSTCWDNVTCYGADMWTTRNAEYGSVNQPSVLKKDRQGLISFELLRYLPHHPHWKDRPYKAGDKIITPKSTYMDLGSFYREDGRIPLEFTYTVMFQKKNQKRNNEEAGGGVY